MLTLAEDRELPLLERAKFSAIFANGLDEFFMVRVAGLKELVAAGLGTVPSADGLTAAEQLARITVRARELALRHANAFADDLVPALARAGVRLVRWGDLGSEDRESLRTTFIDRIFPVLTPLAVDSGHPFPYVSNLSRNLAVLVENTETGQALFARIKVPPVLDRFLTAGDGVLVAIEEVVAANLDVLFPGMRVVEHHAFRVTRDADLDVDDDGAEDLLEAVEDELRRRRVSPAVRLEVESGMPDEVIELLLRELQLGADDLHQLPGPLDLTAGWQLHQLDLPELKVAPFQARTHPALAAAGDSEPDFFGAISQADILVHHPYDSFATSTLRFLEQAAKDPDVQAIKMTLYRTSGESPVVKALVEAAGRGKEVAVLVEIKARFDETNNIGWARVLERAGCHVVYGVIGLKTHAKLCMVVREEQGRLRRYVHVGTGNYNPTTARIYEDIGIFTASPTVGADVANLFNFLTGYAKGADTVSLIVAPRQMRERIVALIEREAELSANGGEGRITLKVNSLLDEAIIEALYAASGKGVEIDLIVRSICALRPQAPGLSERIRVRSIVGRFLEHSRILAFGNGGDPEVYVGSADLMHRNLDRRVETLARVESPALRRELLDCLDLALRDTAGTWLLEPTGRWVRAHPEEGQPAFSLQGELMRRATAGA